MGPLGHGVGAVEHGVLRLGAVLLAVFLHLVLPQRVVDGAGEHLQEGGHGEGQGDLQGLFVDGLDAQGIHRCAVVPDLVIAGDGIEEPFVGAAGGGIHAALERIHIVLGSNRLAVGPLVVPQVEGPYHAVLAQLPGLGVAGHHGIVAVLLTQADQALHHVVDDGAGIGVGYAGDVHGGGVCGDIGVVVFRRCGGIAIARGVTGIALVAVIAAAVSAAGGQGQQHSDGKDHTPYSFHCHSSFFIIPTDYISAIVKI